MDVSVIITKSRTQTNTSSWQKSDANMLADLNIVYQDVFSRLNEKQKKYTRQTYTTDTVVSQNEYTIPKNTVSDTWLKRILKVRVKYTSDWEYVPCNIYDTSTKIDADYTNENIPYVIQRDWSIFLYPAPTEAVTNGLVIDGQYQPIDLLVDDESADIKLWQEYHDILISWLNMRCFGDKQLFDKQQISKWLYEDGIARMLREWGMDMESGYEEEEADLCQYE